MAAFRYRRNVFLNLPFDIQNEKNYLALIAGLSALGLTPRCVLEFPPTSNRLDNLAELISKCSYSVHDLSRVQLSRGAFRCPRFNMPFELGMTIAWNRAMGRRHQWIALESTPYRLQVSLSDLNGFEPFIHGGTVGGVLRALLDAFETRDEVIEMERLKTGYRRLRHFASLSQRRYGWKNLFSPSAFRRLVIASAAISADL